MTYNKMYNHKLINKAIKRYKYFEEINPKDYYNDLLDKYYFYCKKQTLAHYPDTIYGVLTGNPKLNHTAAKNLLFQNNQKCWKYFERTAFFWTIAHSNDPFIDNIKNEFEYALYVGRNDLLNILIQKSISYFEYDEYKSENDFINQEVYPSTQLVHFLTEKQLGHNPIKNKILSFGKGYGIYQRIIDSWDTNFSDIDSFYWDSICEYHLNGIGITGSKRENDEFIGSGLVPMEIINIFQVRKKLGLDIPSIKHELFQTPFATFPNLPTGYQQEFDVIFQLVQLTIQNKKSFSLNDIIKSIKDKGGENIDLLY